MNNKTLLMECAKELFYAKGYDAVGVQEIVERAGLTKPTLYYYFGSKIGLLRTLLETRFERYLSLVKEAVKAERDIRETLYRLGEISCAFYEEDRQFYMLMMALLYSARENEAYQAVRPYFVELYESIVRAFEREAGKLGNMRGRQRQFAIGFLGTIHQYLFLQWETNQEEASGRIGGEQIASVVDQFMYGIFT